MVGNYRSEITCLFMKCCFILSRSSTGPWTAPSELPFKELLLQSSAFDAVLSKFDLAGKSTFPSIVGSGDSIHSLNWQSPSSSGNAFMTSIALTMPIPLQQIQAETNSAYSIPSN